MQAGNTNQRETTEYNNSQRASRTDEYFVVYDVPTVFSVRGETVIVESELLAKALLRLPESRKR